jgi:hypothetical protein
MDPRVAEASVSVSSRSEGARKESVGYNMGRAEDKERASQREACNAGEGAAELARQEIMADKVAADTAVIRLKRIYNF